MKSKLKWLGIIALAALIGFGMTGCGNTPGGTGESQLVISGTLTNNSHGISPNMMARSVQPEPGATQRFSGTVQDDYSIEGLLEDGAMLFRLTGIFDPDTRDFSMQAASSFMVFSLTGRLNYNNAIDPALSSASVQVKDNNNEWKTINLSIAPGTQTVSGQANQSGGAQTPEWSRGIWIDQLIGNTVIITQNSILIGYGDDLTPLTIVEMKNIDANTLELIARISGYDDYSEVFLDYTMRFHITDKFDNKIQSIIPDGIKFTDFNGMPGYDGEPAIKEFIQTQIAANKKIIFVAPYCSNDPTKVDLSDEWSVTEDGYSPLFNGETPTADSKAATEVKAVLSFAMLLMDDDYTGYVPPPPGELTINFDSSNSLNGKWVGAWDARMYEPDFDYSDILITGSDGTQYIQISGGKAVFEVYKHNHSFGQYGYSGNDKNMPFIVQIYNSPPTWDGNNSGGDMHQQGFAIVSFEKGKGAGNYLKPPTLIFDLPADVYKALNDQPYSPFFIQIYEKGTTLEQYKDPEYFSKRDGPASFKDGKMIVEFDYFEAGTFDIFIHYWGSYYPSTFLCDFVTYAIRDVEITYGDINIDWKDGELLELISPNKMTINIPPAMLGNFPTSYVQSTLSQNFFIMEIFPAGTARPAEPPKSSNLYYHEGISAEGRIGYSRLDWSDVSNTQESLTFVYQPDDDFELGVTYDVYYAMYVRRNFTTPTGDCWWYYKASVTVNADTTITWDQFEPYWEDKNIPASAGSGISNGKWW